MHKNHRNFLSFPVTCNNTAFYEGWAWKLLSYLTLCDPMDCNLPGSSVHGIFQAIIMEWIFASPGDLPNPGIKPRSSALQMDSLPSEPPGKPNNTGVGSLCLLQGIFTIQESNRHPLLRRRILYHLIYRKDIQFLTYRYSICSWSQHYKLACHFKKICYLARNGLL